MTDPARRRLPPSWIWLCLLVIGSHSSVLGAVDTADAGAVFAEVGSTILTVGDVDEAMRQMVQSRYYHQAVPQAHVTTIRDAVEDELITRTLLIQEAELRGILVDEDAIQKQLDIYDQRYHDKASWQSRRDTLLPRLERKLREDEMLAALERDVRRLPPPKQTELRAFYAASTALFTEPEQFRVSLILLKVDPAATPAARKAAFAEAEALSSRIRDGADFAALARIHSADKSAANGGDMGYLHAGMLGQSVHTTVSALGIGAVSEPLRVLEGVAILRLDERITPRIRPFGEVRTRAQQLWLRERADAAWARFTKRVRADASVVFYERTAAE